MKTKPKLKLFCANSLKHDEDVVISTAMVLLLAGYDTTGQI